MLLLSLIEAKRYVIRGYQEELLVAALQTGMSAYRATRPLSQAGLARAGYGISSSLPVVFLPSRSRWACWASAKG
jgi:hypothetical protein